MEKPIIRISVRNLVEFILRSGDLTSGGTTAADKEAMLKGSRLHRKIQKQMGSTYLFLLLRVLAVLCTA